MRKLRYRQVLRYRTKGYGKNTYKGQVRLQQGFYLEDNVSNPPIQKVRELHTEIGTWDDRVEWNSIGWYRDTKGVLNFRKGLCNRIVIKYRDFRQWAEIYPKANYKYRLEMMKLKMSDAIKRTEEFFESMGV